MADFQSVSSYLMWDHDRLDAVLYEVLALVSEGTFERARERYAEFIAGMRRHIDLEEKILFPEFEQRSGIKAGPTDLARRDHEIIREALSDMDTAIAAGSPKPFFLARKKFLSVLPSHHAKEEQLLYPVIDESMPEEERLNLVARLQAYP